MPLKGLTEEQLNAVVHRGNLLLTACPGAGKTKTLVSKIAYQLTNNNSNIGKRKLIAITYTNVAAETILNRLDQYGIESANLWVGTVHSFCLEWLIKPYVNLCSRLSKGYRILDEYEKSNLLQRVRQENGLGIYDDIPTILDENLEIQAIPGTLLYSAAQHYHSILTENKLIDFDLILSISSKLLRDTPYISVRLSALFDTIFVDEYQDTNQIQYNILSAIIRARQTSVVLIGDIDQAIYTGLGAVVKNVDDIRAEFSLEDIETLSLSGCFRSTQRIIDFYRNFQDNNIDIRSLSNASQSDTSVTYKNDIHKDELGTHIAELIRYYISKGISLNDIAVLAPQWYDVTRIGKELRRLLPDIDLDAPGVSPIPRSIDNPWYSLIRLYFIEINSINYSKRKRAARYVIEDLESMGFTLNLDQNKIKKILKTINEIPTDATETITNFIELLITEFCTRLVINIEYSREAEEAKSALIDATKSRIEQHNLVDTVHSLFSYFNNNNGVKVTTCHSTKGEEYEVVIAVGLVKGKIPHWNDIIGHNNAHADYVARRLLYVLCSRAKSFLHLISENGHRTRSGIALGPSPQLLAAL